MNLIKILETFEKGCRKQKWLWALGFVAISLVACQASNVSFPNAKFIEGDLYSTTIPALLVKPEGNGPFPAVVLLTTCGGMKPHVTSSWPSFLTGLGYVTITVNSLGARGYKYCTKSNMMNRSYREITRDAYGALDFLVSLPFVDKERVAVMGFSMGAAAINNELAIMRYREKDEPDFKATIAMYGNCNVSVRKGWVPLMRILAEKDRQITPGCLTTEKDNPEIEVHVLAGAYHAFDSPKGSGNTDLSGNVMQYDAKATAKARNLTKEYLERIFSK
jgi:dienelactone hydrolase